MRDEEAATVAVMLERAGIIKPAKVATERRVTVWPLRNTGAGLGATVVVVEGVVVVVVVVVVGAAERVTCIA